MSEQAEKLCDMNLKIQQEQADLRKEKEFLKVRSSELKKLESDYLQLSLTELERNKEDKKDE
jgi:hypothetical protein